MALALLPGRGPRSSSVCWGFRGSNGGEMTNCDYCGTTILFGGQQAGGLRFCNAQCASKGQLIVLSRQLPTSVVQQQVWAVHQGACPQCKGPGPVDVHTSYRVWSALIMTQWSSRPRVSCRGCGVKAKIGDALVSLFVGWWGFPWGLIMTPVQIGRNLVGMASAPDATKPSDKLDTIVRTMLVTRAMQGARADA